MDAAATTVGDAAAAAKAQEFAHRVVEFADVAACLKFFEEKPIDFDRPNAAGATLLMTVVARGRVDLIGYVVDRTTNVESTTIPNGTTVLHLAAMATNPEVIKELTATDARKTKLRAIANACNRNGDTPLMMASVVKNAVAAKILVEYLDALATPKNATGMTALMCASRLRDEREGPAMANESASIVSLLLAYGADVNAAEYAGRQTALHFALLSNNIMVVEQLLTILDINLTARNKAGHSPLELARKLKLDGLIDAAVESQWQVVEEEAQLLSDQVAQELENVAESSAVDSAKKSHKKKDKHKKKPAATTKKEQVSSPVEVHNDELVAEEPSGELDQGEAEPELSPAAPAAATTNDEDSEKWVTATKKKSRRKESVSDDVPQTTMKMTKPLSSSNHAHKAKPKKKVENGSERTKPTTRAKQDILSVKPQAKSVPSAATPVATQRNGAPWSTGTPQNKSNANPSQSSAPPAAPVSALSEQVVSSPIANGEGVTYDDMNAIFHRMYPIAGEMDIPVETFIAGAQTHDAKTLLDGLSVSQIEMLQEAHLQAYHYLNERKIEMARILEAERLEAQLQLRRRLYEMQ